VDGPLRLGVVGVGALTLRGLLPHLHLADVRDRVHVEALCDPVFDRAEAAAADYGVPRVFVDVEAMLAEAEIDAVTVASPIGLHYEHCRAALGAGKHVHANKTLTTTVREADELIGLAEGRDLRIVASPGEVLKPHLARTRELVESGEIGRLSWALCGFAFGEYHEDEPERQAAPGGSSIDPSWYFRRPGGGPMYDMTVYALHQLTSVLGPARSVVSLSGIRIREREFLDTRIPAEADDNTILLLDFGDSLYAVAYGTAAGKHSDQFGAALYFGTHGTIDGILLNGNPFTELQPLPHVIGAHAEMAESHVFEDVMQLADWVLDGAPTPVTAEHARHVIDIIESGYRAAETGTRQELTTTFDLAPLGGLRS
jgi:predicted dehydrogenase